MHNRGVRNRGNWSCRSCQLKHSFRPTFLDRIASLDCANCMRRWIAFCSVMSKKRLRYKAGARGSGRFALSVICYRQLVRESWFSRSLSRGRSLTQIFSSLLFYAVQWSCYFGFNTSPSSDESWSFVRVRGDSSHALNGISKIRSKHRHWERMLQAVPMCGSKPRVPSLLFRSSQTMAISHFRLSS